MEKINYEQVQIKLTKKKCGGLGFLIAVKEENKAYVCNIVIGSNAQHRGQLRVYDEIISVDKNIFRSVNDLKDYLTKVKIGKTIELTLKRQVLLNSGQAIILKESSSNNTANENPLKKRLSKIKKNSREERKDSKCLKNKENDDSQKEKAYKLTNMLDGSEMVDSLYMKSGENPCTLKKCCGSIYTPEPSNKRAPGVLRSKEETKRQALDFLNQYYISMKSENTESHSQRVEQVAKEIEEKGTYKMNENELIFGARLAWRNSARCIGRIQWKKLQVFDCRHVFTAREMFECCLQHMKYATNKGKIRSTITVFPPRRENLRDFRIWNSQLFQYAGYKQLDGNIIGDPASVEITEIAQKLGWVGGGTQFDVLPLILQADGCQPEWFEIPKEYILEVNISHPKYPKLNKLNLKWYSLPAVSSIMLDCGGLEFTAAPFNGWYMASEIGARNFTDTSRYNLSKPIAHALNLNTTNNGTLWKDTVMVELTFATLYSFNQAGVTMVDHHTASESFMKHYKDEMKIRGGCPADWVWIIPPLSASSTPVFHQEMLNYKLVPSYEYQTNPWKYFTMKQQNDSKRKKIAFKDVAKAVKFSAKMMVNALAKRHKVTILFATETGKSETYAQTLNALFLNAFDSKVVCMEDYSFPDIENDQCILIVTSTSGNGEAPENGKMFGKRLYSLLYPSSEAMVFRSDDAFKTDSVLCNLRYSVFALGSRAYPYFCAYGHFVNNLISKLGGEEITFIGEGDELCGQEEAFKNWAQSCFEAACETFCVNDISISEVKNFFTKASSDGTDSMYRITPANTDVKRESLCEALSKLHKRNIFVNRNISVRNLQSETSGRVTNLVRLKITCKEEMEYRPGDHLCVYPMNDANMVKDLLNRLEITTGLTELISIEIEKEDQFTRNKRWETIKTLPMPATLERIFSSYLDINSPPTTKLLKLFSIHCSAEDERLQLSFLSENPGQYEDWKYQNYPNLLEVLQKFPSIKIDASLLINHLPILKPRHYSISSSQSIHPDEIHITVALVRYTLKNGNQHAGVCSSWLHSLSGGDVVPCFIKSATLFHLPVTSSEPVIMIGPGTGIAPFRSFWQENNLKGKNKEAFSEMLLFFGCRDSQQDDIYADETARMIEQGGLSKVYTAYSRDKNHPKKYVQNLLKERLEEICDLIVSKFAHVYVCGDVTMASDVFKTITEMLEKYLALSSCESQDYMSELRSSARYHEDIFGVTLKLQEVTTRIRTAAKRTRKRISNKRSTPSFKEFHQITIDMEDPM